MRMPAETFPALAIDGGSKTWNRQLPQWPQFGKEARKAAAEVLKSGRVNYWTGSEGRKFEDAFAAWLGTRNAIAVSNGTAALQVALMALGIGPGDEVICTPYSFMASSLSILEAGALPIFADVDDNHLIDPAKIEAAITPRTKAVVVVHLYGLVADMEAIGDVARRHGLRIIEDCAQCLGGRSGNRMVGTLGDVGCFSFCQNKHITTGGEGGMICCNDDSVAWECRSLRDHGCDAQARFTLPGRPIAFRRIGFNFRITEMQSAIGLAELLRFDSWNLPRRNRRAEILAKSLANHPLVKKLPEPVANTVPSYWLYPIVIDKRKLRKGITVREVVAALQAEGVPAYSILWPEMFREELYRKRRGTGNCNFPFGAGGQDSRSIDYAHCSTPVAHSLLLSTIGFWVHPVYPEALMHASVKAFIKVANHFSIC